MNESYQTREGHNDNENNARSMLFHRTPPRVLADEYSRSGTAGVGVRRPYGWRMGSRRL